MSDIPIKRALIAVYDKTGIADFARALVNEFGIEIISTGGTAKHLKEAGIPVTMVEEVTGFPEMLDGRVKTLHPMIHAGILADRDNPEHMRTLQQHGIKPIDMVVVNLYPFEKTVADPNCTFEQAIEMIDIGGPCMLRAAAKNHGSVLVVSDPGQYGIAWGNIQRCDGGSDYEVRSMFAEWAFLVTSHYDFAVDNYLAAYQRYAIEQAAHGESQDAIAQLTEGGSLDSALGALAELFPLGESDESGIPKGFDMAKFMSVGKRIVQDLSSRVEALKSKPVSRPLSSVRAAVSLSLEAEARYGENPSQKAALWSIDWQTGFASPSGQETAAVEAIMPHAERLGGGELSFNNYIDGDAALGLVKELARAGFRVGPASCRSTIGPDTYPRLYLPQIQTPGETPVPHDAEHRRDAGATADESHRLETGATQSEMSPPESGSTHAVAFIKHTNACGCAIGDDPIETYRRAYLGDPIAAAGGVLCMNFPVTKDIADTVMNTYGKWGKAAGAAFFKLDVWIAPSFDEDAVTLITTPTEKRKWGKECRLLAVGPMDAPPDPNELDYKKITGGILVQTRDLLGLNEDQWKVVTKRAPSESEMADLRFAWLVCKHTKSNAITIVRDGMLLGSGAGQMSRVKSCDLAIQLSRENGHGDKLTGAVAAGDAFFPVPDGPQKLIDAGITAIIHPGGSNRDAETIALCDAANVAMILTGTRHFKH